MFKMIDIGNKPITHRIAIARGEIAVGKQAFELIRDKKLPKGDVLVLAEIAGINGAKKAYEAIPLCHPMSLDQVQVNTELNAQDNKIIITCLAATHAKTGVEMEAIAGVNSALLTVWDLSKMIEPNLNISNVRLLAKAGGKKGLWLNPEGVSPEILQLVQPPLEQVLSGRRAVVITLSDRASRGEYEDQSGALLQEILANYGAEIINRIIRKRNRSIHNRLSDSRLFNGDCVFFLLSWSLNRDFFLS